jgi:DNA-binding response OmpR family regulator
LSQHVLIADDEPNIVISLEYLLKKEGFQVTVATDGEAAIRMAGELKPQLVLLDIMMPKKSGFEVCESLRANPELADLKIIMLTAKGRDTEVTKGLALGANAYVTKPFSTKELVTQIKSLLSQ